MTLERIKMRKRKVTMKIAIYQNIKNFIKSSYYLTSVIVLNSMISIQSHAIETMSEKSLATAASYYDNNQTFLLTKQYNYGNPFAAMMLVRCYDVQDSCELKHTRKNKKRVATYRSSFDIADMMEVLTTYEARGNQDARNWMAYYYLDLNRPTGDDEAFKLLKKNAQAGNATAMYELGNFYTLGRFPVSQNKKRAFYWYKLAVQKNHLLAMRRVVNMYSSGDSMNMSPEEFQLLKSKIRRIDLQNDVMTGMENLPTSASGKGSSSNTSKSIDLNQTSKNTIITTYFGTNRNVLETTNPKQMFGEKPAKLTYGTIKVSIPKDHRIGEIESPFLWFKPDINKHVMFPRNAVELLKPDEFFTKLRARLSCKTDLNKPVKHFSSDAHLRVSNTKDKEDNQVTDCADKKRALVFIHGFNNSFENAAKRTAQMSYDLQFEGAPIFYSWPASKTIIPLISNYRNNEKNIKASIPLVTEFLTDVLSKSDAEEVYLIAHSMGNRALIQSIHNVLRENPGFNERIKEVILAAPDVDAKVFKQDIAPVLTEQLKKPITLYTSTKDLALTVSRQVNGASRLGDANYPVIIDGIEMVDASSVDTSFLGHSYYGENTSVISDIVCLMHKNMRADERKQLTEITNQKKRHWLFKGANTARKDVATVSIPAICKVDNQK